MMSLTLGHRPTPLSVDTTFLKVSGPIVGVDGLTDVGEWDVTISAATPLPRTLPLFDAGLGLVGLLARRPKRKNSATTATA